MSFFGFNQHNDLEREKRRFLETGGAQNEDLAVYTWGEENYDGLGDALQEGGDELNDETFGIPGSVGKDFDFSNTVLPGDANPYPPGPAHEWDAPVPEQQTSRVPHSDAPPRPAHASVWDDKSPFSVLPRMNGGGSRAADQSLAQSSRSQMYGSLGPQASTSQQSIPINLGGNLHKGAHTVEEIEAEMLAAAAAQHQRHQPQPQPQLTAVSQSQMRGQIPRQATPQHVVTPPPRMHPHSQSPRFHHQQQQHQIHAFQLQQQTQQRQLLELQEQRELRHQQQLLELQEQLRLEELERQRQIRMQQMPPGTPNHIHNHLLHQRHTSGGISPAPSDRQRRLGRQSPALIPQIPADVPFQQSLQYLPQDIQLQQRLLAEMAQAEFIQNMQSGGLPSERDPREDRGMQEVLRAEAMRKIMEAERMEEKRRRKLMKIAHMSRYNDLMTQSDKDFITRIQVSQLVTQDPYADDFYAQVYGAITRSRMGVQSQDDRVLKFGSGGGVGLGLAQKGPVRRQSAMQRMEAQVERIVNNARLREKEKISLNSLQGALGKTSGRSYKAAPRQLLQVDSGNSAASPSPSPAHAHISKADAASVSDGHGVAREAAKIGHEALGGSSDGSGLVRKDPLSHRQTLVLLEQLYDNVLEVEQLRREQPPPQEEDAFQSWDLEFSELTEKLWDDLKVMVPLETSNPHPFVSLLTPIKGKRLLPRVARHLSTQQMLTVLTLLVACFSQLDVVIHAPLLDTLEETRERADVDNQTQAFLGSVVQSILPVVAKAGLRLVSGLLGLLLERSNVVAVTRTKPGIALLTLFLSRVEVIKQNMASATEISELPSPEETEQWQLMFDHFFQLLAPHLLLLFPSVRLNATSGIGYANVPNADVIDQPVWQFLAALALHASLEQQQILVTSLREIVLENVTSANKGWVADAEERRTRLGNVNIFLHALGLDSSQIAV
ncbi:topoisomerase II-associated protein [Amylocystis lapponica]|nr:topoisomerase II-associated protein [Amylocystis lapponica]